MSSWCIGLKAGPAGLPDPGPSWCRGLCARHLGRNQPVLYIRHYVRVLLLSRPRVGVLHTLVLEGARQAQTPRFSGTRPIGPYPLDCSQGAAGCAQTAA